MSENKIEILDKNNNNIKIKLLRGFSNIYGVETNENFIFIPEFLTGNIYIIDKKKYKISKYFILDDKLIDKKPLLKLRSENLKKIHDVYIDKKKNFFITSAEGAVYIFDKNMKFLFKIDKSISHLKFPVMVHLNEEFLFITEYDGNKILRYKLSNFEMIDWIGYKEISEDEKFRFKKNGWQNKKNFFSIDLNKPHALREDKKYFYIVDTANHRILRLDKESKEINWIGKSRSGIKKNRWSDNIEIGLNSSEIGGFNQPIDLHIRGNYLYVSDHAGRIIKIDKNSGESLEWFGELENNKLGWFSTNKNYESQSPTGINLPYGFRIFKNDLYLSDRGGNFVKIFYSVIND